MRIGEDEGLPNPDLTTRQPDGVPRWHHEVDENRIYLTATAGGLITASFAPLEVRGGTSARVCMT